RRITWPLSIESAARRSGKGLPSMETRWYVRARVSELPGAWSFEQAAMVAAQTTSERSDKRGRGIRRASEEASSKVVVWRASGQRRLNTGKGAWKRIGWVKIERKSGELKR